MLIPNPAKLCTRSNFLGRFATQLIQFTLATLIERFEFQLVDTIWGRDVAIYRESLLTAPAFRSQAVKLKLVGLRGQDLR